MDAAFWAAFVFVFGGWFQILFAATLAAAVLAGLLIVVLYLTRYMLGRW